MYICVQNTNMERFTFDKLDAWSVQNSSGARWKCLCGPLLSHGLQFKNQCLRIFSNIA